MDSNNKTLIQLLSMTDAIYRPLRRPDWQSHSPAVAYEIRQSAAGIPWTIGGSAYNRVKAERELQRLAERRLVILHGKGARRSGVSLATDGEHIARSLCGLPTVANSWRFLRQVIAKAVNDDDYGPLCPEYWLTDPPLKSYAGDYQAALMAVQDNAAPGLLRGWLETKSDIHGRAYYLPTDAGLDAADAEPPKVPDGLPGEAEGAARFYYESVLEFRDKMRDMKPANPSEIGPIPLPASIWLKGMDDDDD